MNRTLLRAAGLALILTTAAIAQPQPPQRPNVGSAPHPAATAAEPGSLLLTAALAGETGAIRGGLVWRVYRETAEGALLLVARSETAAPSFQLPPGDYIAHVAYGLAGATRRYTLAGATQIDRLTIEAGGLKLGGQVGDSPIAPQKLSFNVYAPLSGNLEGRLVAERVRAGDVLRLPAGPYHVVSTYGDSNAIVRADLRVESGRLTEATLRHRAATVTLKLVSRPGGEAFANTAWSVLTPGGDVIRETVGAFSSITLADGVYTVIARNDGQVYTAEFRVQSGVDRDVEVLAK